MAAFLCTVSLGLPTVASISGCDAPPPRESMPVAGKLLLTGATVVDTLDGGLLPDMNVLMDGGKIVRVAPAGTAFPDAPADSIDARGKFVVPGYLDMHAHPLNDDDPSGSFALMLANGVTGFRQMSGSHDLLAQRRAGTLPVTRSSPEALILPGTVLTPVNAGTPETAVAEIRDQHADGADFIKVAIVAPAVFEAALAEAGRLGLPFVGHLQQGIDATDAARAGMDSIEHLGPVDTVLISCTTEEAALRQEIAARPVPKGLGFRIPFADKLVGLVMARIIVNPVLLGDASDAARYRREIDSYDEERCRGVAAVFVEQETWHVPTLIRSRTTELGDAPEYMNDPNLRYVRPETVELWRDVAAEFTELPAASKATLRDFYALRLRLVKLLDSEGVKMLAGSDSGGAGWLVPGFSLHQEFDELQKAGLSPLRVLQMTTIDGAEYLGRTSTMGSVAAGKNADLVLLDANPIESVQSLHAISGVVRAGFYYSRDALDALQKEVEAGQGVIR